MNTCAQQMPDHRRGRRRPLLSARWSLSALLLTAVLAGCSCDGDHGGQARRQGSDSEPAPGPAASAPRGPAASADQAAAAAPTGAGTRGTDVRGSDTAPSPRIALVIDDLGRRPVGPAAAILALPVPLTLAVLPGLTHSRQIAALATADTSSATAARREIWLHLPMQPLDYPATDPGPGALLVGMGAADVADRLDAALATVPGARGVNNHMGSAATADTLLMDILMTELRARGLRFLDSLTTPRSVAWRAARAHGVPSLRNRLFLDVRPDDEAAITAYLDELVTVARKRGQAVGIAHPHAATAAVLARELPRYVAEGVRFVTLSELRLEPLSPVTARLEPHDAR